jgi:hypothetical protein
LKKKKKIQHGIVGLVAFNLVYLSHTKAISITVFLDPFVQNSNMQLCVPEVASHTEQNHPIKEHSGEYLLVYWRNIGINVFVLMTEILPNAVRATKHLTCSPHPIKAVGLCMRDLTNTKKTTRSKSTFGAG